MSNEFNQYTPITYKSNAQYRDILSVNFQPMVEVKTTKRFNKGDWRFWKWLGLIPLIPYKVKEDLYTRDEYERDGMHTLKDIQNSLYRKTVIKNDHIYYLATVITQTLSKGTEYHDFFSNADAMNYLNKLKENCKKVGNDLK